MLDAFEARMIEILGDALATVPALAVVSRAHDGLLEPSGEQVRLQVRLMDARPRSEVGDDGMARFRRGDDWRERVELALEGEVELWFEIGVADANQRAQQRQRLIRTVDRTLIVLADEAMRRGDAFRSDHDLGFELDGFRLLAVEAPRDSSGEGEGRTMAIRCSYSGRFWPVGEEQTGVAIQELGVRQVVLPVGLPSGLRVAVGVELEIPLEVALGVLRVGGAELPEPTLMARLVGASPGELLGGAEPSAPGWVRVVPGAAGRFTLRYRAPSAVSGRAEARIALGFARPDGARVDLGTLTVEVHE